MDLTDDELAVKGNNDIESGKSQSELIEYNPEAIPNFIISSMKQVTLDKKECDKLKLDVYDMMKIEFNNLWEFVSLRFKEERTGSDHSESDLESIPFKITNDMGATKEK